MPRQTDDPLRARLTANQVARAAGLCFLLLAYVVVVALFPGTWLVENVLVGPYYVGFPIWVGLYIAAGLCVDRE